MALQEDLAESKVVKHLPSEGGDKEKCEGVETRVPGTVLRVGSLTSFSHSSQLLRK